MMKDTPIQAFAKALLLQEWFQIMKKEHSKEMAEKFYYAYILSKNEPQSVKNKTIGFLRKFIDIRTPQCQLLCVVGGSAIIAGGYTLLMPHWTTDFFMRRVLIKTPKALVPVVNGAIPIVAETVKNIVVQQAICKAVEYSAELAMSRELVCLLPLFGQPGMAPIIEAVIRTSMLRNGRLNRNFGGLNFTKFNNTPNL